MYTIHTATQEEVQLAVEWAAQEGWNPGLFDAKAFYSQDQSGFFVGKLRGEPISCISCVRYPHKFGFIGFYIVSPKYRGQGYGFKIWDHAMKYGNGCTIGLDGVPAQQDNYSRSGFTFAYRNIRYEYLKGSKREESPDVPEDIALSKDLSFEQIAVFDALHFGGERQEFLRAWLNLERSLSLVAQKDGEIRGYVTLRECRSGYKIGPLFASSPLLAEALFLKVIEKVPQGAPIYLDVPEPNHEALALAERYDMQPAFYTARMYRGDPPNLPLDRIFGVTTFELG